MLGKWRTPITLLLVAAFFLALAPISAHSAAGGQIKGKLTDKENDDPIIGASVQIMGTKQGAQSDFDGYFAIPQVEPGTYRLRISAVGYGSIEVTDVTVNADLTTEVNQALSKEASDIGVTIEVKAKQDIIDKFQVSNTTTINKDVIETAPVSTVDDLLGQVAGVVKNTSGEVFIRGGRSDEVAYIVDGVPVNDPLGGGGAGANLSLVSGSIQEIQIIKDGFDPEYGDALSGIVNIRTQTGSKDNTRLSLQYITDDFGNSNLNKYSRNSDYVRFSLSGPDPIFKNKILPALGLNYLAEKEFTYYFYAEVDKDDGIFQYTDYDTPTTRSRYDSFDFLGIGVPDRVFNKYYVMANLMFRPKPSMKFILSYKDQQTREKLSIIDDLGAIWDYRYTSATAPITKDRWRSLSLEVSQSVTKTTNYELVLSFSQRNYNRRPGDPNNPGQGLNPDQFYFDFENESFEDRNGNGVYDAPEPIVNLFPDTASYGDGVTGPAYTQGELNLEDNIQGAESNISGFRFNNNGIVDNLEGEPFIDLNGNGVWDQGDYLRDRNGNGVLDFERVSTVDQRNPEVYIDGDSIIGEPFTDLNANGIYDRGIDAFVRSAGPENMDLNHNGKYDGPLDQWTVGVPYEDRNGNGIYDSPNSRYDLGEPFVDRNGNSRWDAGGASTFLDPLSYDENATWLNYGTDTYRGELKLFKELGRHQLKGGVALKVEDVLYEEIQQPYLLYTGIDDGGPYAEAGSARGSFRDIWAYQPWGGTVYFRDKLEYGSMIASLGFRWDFFIQDTDQLVEVARNDELGSGVILGDRQKFAPRIGFSYPISDKAKVHFNYGHFYQRPSLTHLYARNTTSVDQNVIIGNYNLDYKKTVQYSFGVKYAMSENYAIDVSGYFKDEFDKINSQQVRLGGLTFQQYRNSDYGRSRGFEVELTKRGGGYVNGQVNYTYAFAFGKASQTNENYLSDFLLSREPLSEAPLDNDVRHALKAAIQVFVPSTVKPRLFGQPIPNGWSLSLETFVESGRPFTPSNLYPGISRANAGEDIQRNSLRKPAVVNFDIRFTKDFSLASLDYKFILWVENVFDNENVVSVYSGTGRPDTRQNQSGLIKGGTEYDLNPSNWDYGRQIRVGLELNI